MLLARFFTLWLGQPVGKSLSFLGRRWTQSTVRLASRLQQKRQRGIEAIGYFGSLGTTAHSPCSVRANAHSQYTLSVEQYCICDTALRDDDDEAKAHQVASLGSWAQVVMLYSAFNNGYVRKHSRQPSPVPALSTDTSCPTSQLGLDNGRGHRQGISESPPSTVGSRNLASRLEGGGGQSGRTRESRRRLSGGALAACTPIRGTQCLLPYGYLSPLLPTRGHVPYMPRAGPLHICTQSPTTARRILTRFLPVNGWPWRLRVETEVADDTSATAAALMYVPSHRR